LLIVSATCAFALVPMSNSNRATRNGFADK
jgi:hypothetical protein